MMRGLGNQMRGLALSGTLAVMRTLRWAALSEAAARLCSRWSSTSLLQSCSIVSWPFVSFAVALKVPCA